MPQCFIEQGFDIRRLIFDDPVAVRLVPFGSQEFFDGLSARVRRFIPSVADGDDEAANAFFASFFVLVNCHRSSPEKSQKES